MRKLIEKVFALKYSMAYSGSEALRLFQKLKKERILVSPEWGLWIHKGDGSDSKGEVGEIVSTVF